MTSPDSNQAAAPVNIRDENERFRERIDALSAFHNSSLVGAMIGIMLTSRTLFVATRLTFLKGQDHDDPVAKAKLDASMEIEQKLEGAIVNNLLPILMRDGVDVDRLEADVKRLLNEQADMQRRGFENGFTS